MPKKLYYFQCTDCESIKESETPCLFTWPEDTMPEFCPWTGEISTWVKVDDPTGSA